MGVSFSGRVTRPDEKRRTPQDTVKHWKNRLPEGQRKEPVMKCPHCQTENENTARQCSACGASLQDQQAAAAGLKAVTAGGIVFGKKARESRIREIVDPSLIISTRAYNTIIGAVLLWGLLINYILCWKVGSYTSLFPNMSPITFLIGYVAVATIGMVITFKSSSPVMSFIGYNLVVIPFGVLISTFVEEYGGISSAVVTQAFLYTLLISVAILATVIVFPQWFEKLGGALGAVLIGLILSEILMLIFRVNQIVTSWVAAGLFSLYLGYDIYRSQQYPKTLKNAVASALDIYMDIANIFIRILEITGNKDN